MTWVVTGGAGYIGSHVVAAFAAEGIPSIVLDDLNSGRTAFVPDGVELHHGSITDAPAVAEVLRRPGVEGVVHVAALKYAGVSVREPLDSYRVNVEGTRILLDECLKAGVRNVVFSSSAAVFGTPDTDLVTEDTPKNPESPYGESKLIGEWLLRDVARAAELNGDRPFRHTSLRYFNVVGSGIPTVYDVSPHNLFPILLAAVTEGRTPTVFGDDYATPDGSCVRDYIHVADVASAHVAAARALAAGRDIAPAYNLGRGEGVSVKEIIAAVADVIGRPVSYDVGPRRPGDPARIVTSSERAQADLGWTAQYDLHEMVQSAWDAWNVAAAEGTARLG
ncbi:MAG: UDP-glucose 4-epimerase GalE [Candidatus Nanopelagicales bacterium]|jgi:UDP-glucose 4-epimerase